MDRHYYFTTNDAKSQVEKILLRNQKLLSDQNIKFDFKNDATRLTIDGDTLGILVLIEKQVTVLQRDEPRHEYTACVIKNGTANLQHLVLSDQDIINNNSGLLVKQLGLKAFGKQNQVDLIWKITRNSCANAISTEEFDVAGWFMYNANLCFACGNRLVTTNGTTNIKNRKSCDVADIDVETACKFVRETYLALLNNKLYSIITLSFCILANLQYGIKRVGGFVSFMLYVWGATGTGKTSTAFPMLNPFDVPNISLNDTSAASMYTLNYNSCSTTIIDDVKSQSGNAIKVLDRSLRIASDRTTSYSKLNGNSVQSVELDNLVAATAEIPLPLQTSSFPRTLMLQFDHNTVNTVALHDLEKNPDSFKEYARAFILYFLEHVLSQPDWFKRFVAKYENERSKQIMELGNYRLHGRYYNTVAWIVAIWAELKTFLQAHRVEVDDAGFEQVLQGMVIKQHKRYSESDPVIVFCKTLFHLIKSKKLKYADRSLQTGDEDIVFSDGTMRLRSVVVYEKVRAWCEQHETDFTISEAELRRRLDEHGLIAVNKTATKYNRTFDTKINGISVSYIKFYKHKAHELLAERGDDDE